MITKKIQENNKKTDNKNEKTTITRLIRKPNIENKK